MIVALGTSQLACAGAPADGVTRALPRPSATSAEILAATTAADWRPLDPARTLALTLAGDPVPEPVVIELAPPFAPRHVANVVELARAGYFNGLAIVRVQDNDVVQWGDADGKRALPPVDEELPAEFEAPSAALPFMWPPPLTAPEAMRPSREDEVRRHRLCATVQAAMRRALAGRIV